MDDDSLHTLLSKGHLSGAQRERVLEKALSRARPGGARRWAAVSLGGLLSVAAALALFLHAQTPSAPANAPGTLVAKGPSGPLASAHCEGRAPGECHPGDRLIFEVEGLTSKRFFGAYADCDSRERIWYFPTATGSLPELEPAPRALVDQAARLGPEHGAGRCTLHLFVLEHPVDRASLASGGLPEATLALDLRP